MTDALRHGSASNSRGKRAERLTRQRWKTKRGVGKSQEDSFKQLMKMLIVLPSLEFRDLQKNYSLHEVIDGFSYLGHKTH